MPFLPFVVLLAWQALSRSASFALGWATAIYFGQVPGRAALMRELPFRNAWITWSGDARELEDAVMAAHHRGAERTRLHGELESVQRRMDAADLEPDEWNLLYRLRLQVEQRAAERAGDYRAKVRMAKPATMTKATNTTTSRATQLVRRSG